MSDDDMGCFGDARTNRPVYYNGSYPMPDQVSLLCVSGTHVAFVCSLKGLFLKTVRICQRKENSHGVA